MAHTAVVIMAKAPCPGQVKTRLCPPLTPWQAATLSRAFLRRQDCADADAHLGQTGYSLYAGSR